MMINRAVILDSGQGLFLADGGGWTLKLHNIRVFVADDPEIDKWLRMGRPYLSKVLCEGDWCTKFGVITHGRD